jgi:hypothetical protein
VQIHPKVENRIEQTGGMLPFFVTLVYPQDGFKSNKAAAIGWSRGCTTCSQNGVNKERPLQIAFYVVRYMYSCDVTDAILIPLPYDE